MKSIKASRATILYRSGSSLNGPVNDIANGTKPFIKSHSTAEIGTMNDAKREKQLRELARHFAQPKKVQQLSAKDRRRKQVEAIYEYIRAHGMETVPPGIARGLEEYVNENRRFLAWLPTEPKYFVVCEPIIERVKTPSPSPSPSSATSTSLPSSASPSPIDPIDSHNTPTRDQRKPTISMASPHTKFDFGEDIFDPAKPPSTQFVFATAPSEVGDGKPQGFLLSLDDTVGSGAPMGFMECMDEVEPSPELFNMYRSKSIKS